MTSDQVNALTLALLSNGDPGHKNLVAMLRELDRDTLIDLEHRVADVNNTIQFVMEGEDDE